MIDFQLLSSCRRSRALLVLACTAVATSSAPLLGQSATPDAQVRRIDVLIVLYTRSFSQTLTRDQIERVHEEVFEFVDFYQSAAGDAVDFRISLLQIDRELALSEVAEVAPGRYYLSRENIEAELSALGMLEHEFDETSLASRGRLRRPVRVPQGCSVEADFGVAWPRLE